MGKGGHCLLLDSDSIAVSLAFQGHRSQDRLSTMRTERARLDSLNLLLPLRFMDNETRQTARDAYKQPVALAEWHSSPGTTNHGRRKKLRNGQTHAQKDAPGRSSAASRRIRASFSGSSDTGVERALSTATIENHRRSDSSRACAWTPDACARLHRS